MRVDAYSAVSQIYQKSNNVSVKKKNNRDAVATDKFEISQSAKDYQVAKEAVSNASDIREDKVADIKARLAAGTYKVSTEAIADKILGTAKTFAF